MSFFDNFRKTPAKPIAPIDGPVKPVTIYTTRFCGYCLRAKSLLTQKGVEFQEIPVDGDPGLRNEMIEKSGGYTVPQIWIGDTHVGGCDELMMLQRREALDEMLMLDPADE
jgi:glutaredoxin 3